MREHERELTPINESWKNSKRIYANIPFPGWLDSEKIGLDVRRTEMLMQLGGIRYTRFVGTKENNKDEDTAFTVVGIASDGSAYAGRAIVKKEDLFERNLIDRENSFYLHNTDWRDLDLKINMKAFEKKIIESGDSLRQADSWIPQLDKILRKGIREAGTKHLLTFDNNFQKFAALFININNTLLDSADSSIFNLMYRNFNPHVPSGAELANEILFTALFWNLWCSLFKGYEKSGEGYRVSLFPGFEVDRVIALQILSRIKKVVQKI